MDALLPFTEFAIAIIRKVRHVRLCAKSGWPLYANSVAPSAHPWGSWVVKFGDGKSGNHLDARFTIQVIEFAVWQSVLKSEFEFSSISRFPIFSFFARNLFHPKRRYWKLSRFLFTLYSIISWWSLNSLFHSARKCFLSLFLFHLSWHRWQLQEQCLS